MSKDIIVFDSQCIMCNSIVKWIIKHDYKNQFKFSSSKSKFCENLDEKYKLSITIILTNNSKISKTKAVHHILKKINKLYLFRALLKLIPIKISNCIYDLIANNRYLFFNKTDNCQITQKNYKSKIIS